MACQGVEAQHHTRGLPWKRLARYLAAAWAQEHLPVGMLTHAAFGRAAQLIAAHLHHRPYAQRVQTTPQVHRYNGSLAQEYFFHRHCNSLHRMSVEFHIEGRSDRVMRSHPVETVGKDMAVARHLQAAAESLRKVWMVDTGHYQVKCPSVVGFAWKDSLESDRAIGCSWSPVPFFSCRLLHWLN